MEENNFKDMSKEELIEFIKKLQTQRAFSYEDQIKLAIIDRSPFSIWTSDRNCNITLWAGQCESMYGYTKEEVMGKSYIDMFVAEDERATAQKDHLCIVDDGKPYHNLARDVHLDGSHPLILTNCFRIKDPRSDNYWYAEMGLNIEFYDEELRKYNEMVLTSQKIKECRKKLDTYADQFKEKIADRRNSFIKALVDASRTVQVSEQGEFQSCVHDIKETIATVVGKIDETTTEYSTKITSCDDIDRCEKIYREFLRKCADLELIFDDIEMQVYSLINEHNATIAQLLQEKDGLIKQIDDLGSRVSKEIDKKIVDAQERRKPHENNPESAIYKDYDNLIMSLQKKLESLYNLEDVLRQRVLAVSSESEITIIKQEITKTFSEFEYE